MRLHTLSLCFALAALSGCNCGGAAPPPAQLSASPTLLDFGTQPTGIQVTRALTLRNDGGASAALLSATVEDDTRGTFSFEGLPSTLEPSATAELKVRYAVPSEEGADRAALVVRAGGEVRLRVTLTAQAILSCPSDQKLCGGICTEVTTDLQNCGSCGQACASGQSCEDGVCTCVPQACSEEPRQCGLVDDGCGGAMDCGACSYGGTCTDGLCVCPTGETQEVQCGDGLDDDCDGRIDCADPDCAQDAACASCLSGEDLRITHDARAQYSASLVWTGSEFGLLWLQWATSGGYNDYGFARVLPDGTVPGGQLDVAPLAQAAQPPVLQWDGQGFGFAWGDARDEAASSDDVYFARLDSEGARLLDDNLEVGGPQRSTQARAAWSAANAEYGVVFTDTRDAPSPDGDNELYFTRLTPDGAKVGGDVRLTQASGRAESPDLVAAGDHYELVYVDNRDGMRRVYFSLLDSSGSRVGTELVLSGTAPTFSPRIAWNGTDFGVVWSDARTGPNELFFARVDGTGKASPAVQVTTAGGNVSGPVIAWDGTLWGVAWSDHRTGIERVYFGNLLADGKLLRPEQVLSCQANAANAPALVWTGSAYAAAWSDSRRGNVETEIYLRTWTPVR